jgi:hypothetical protein
MATFGTGNGLLGRRSAVIGITNGEGPRPMYKRYFTIALLHITRLEPLQTPRTTGDRAAG